MRNRVFFLYDRLKRLAIELLNSPYDSLEK